MEHMIEDPELLENLEIMPPGPDLAKLLATVDRKTLPDHMVPLLLRARLRQLAHTQAELMGDMSVVLDRYGEDRFDYPPTYGGKFDPEDLAATEIAPALVWTENAAAAQLNMADACMKRLPALQQAMLAGELDYPRALLFVDATKYLDDKVARDLVDQLLPEARYKTTAQLRDKLRRLILKADPQAATKRQQGAHADRG